MPGAKLCEIITKRTRFSVRRSGSSFGNRALLSQDWAGSVQIRAFAAGLCVFSANCCKAVLVHYRLTLLPQGRTTLVYEMPLAEMVTDFFDELKVSCLPQISSPRSLACSSFRFCQNSCLSSSCWINYCTLHNSSTARGLLTGVICKDLGTKRGGDKVARELL